LRIRAEQEELIREHRRIKTEESNRHKEWASNKVAINKMDEVRLEQGKILLLENSFANNKIIEIKNRKKQKEREDTEKFDNLEKRDWEWKVLREEQEAIKLIEKNKNIRDALDVE